MNSFKLIMGLLGKAFLCLVAGYVIVVVIAHLCPITLPTIHWPKWPHNEQLIVNSLIVGNDCHDITLINTNTTYITIQPQERIVEKVYVPTPAPAPAPIQKTTETIKEFPLDFIPNFEVPLIPRCNGDTIRVRIPAGQYVRCILPPPGWIITPEAMGELGSFESEIDGQNANIPFRGIAHRYGYWNKSSNDLDVYFHCERNVKRYHYYIWPFVPRH